MVKGVLFDLGNTLIDFEGKPWEELRKDALRAVTERLSGMCRTSVAFPEVHAAFEEALADERKKAAEAEREIPLSSLMRGMASRLRLSLTKTLLDEMVRAHYRPIRAQISIYADTRSTLELLQRKSIRMGIVSNTYWPAVFHEDDLERFGIAGFFDTLVFSSSFGFCKPHPSIFRKGLNGLATAPEETLFIGDRLDVDVAGAQKVGMRGILKRHPYREEEMSGVVPDGIIDRLEEIRSFL